MNSTHITKKWIKIKRNSLGTKIYEPNIVLIRQSKNNHSPIDITSVYKLYKTYGNSKRWINNVSQYMATNKPKNINKAELLRLKPDSISEVA